MSPALAENHMEPEIAEVLDIAPVWSGHRVGFALLTHGSYQYVAFYDQHRRMTVAMRTLESDQWRFQKLDSQVGWDSHNYITMAVDADGRLHLSGNMHCVPLVYFRTRQPYDIRTFERIPQMVGEREKRCTYPKFYKGPADELIFAYRDGGSGNGVRIFNVYDTETQSWRRLLDTPLTDGRGRMNAYPVGPVRGPDGFYHLCWVWRDTPDCSTNHDLSYARSRDFVHWQTAAGSPIELPMTLNTPGLIVDPVPAKGGLINGNTKIGFDCRGRLIISYHKFYADGATQLYNARLENGCWKIYQTSDWDYRWYFQGGGSIQFEIHVSPASCDIEDRLIQPYSSRKHGSGTWQLDEQTLKPIGKVQRMRPWPGELSRLRSELPAMQVRRQSDAGASNLQKGRYFLRWETLGANRDRPRKQAPPATMLQLYRIRYR